jgi:small subunit ribosomal protein S16
MSVSIKLSRFGAKKAPFYRIVAQTTKSKRDGKSLEIVGTWNPRTKELNVKKEKLDEWLKKGALITDGVKKLLK